MATQKLIRPVAYFGGKSEIADFICRHIPPHECFVDVFGGGAGLLLNKPRSPIEIYNDLDGEIVNLFRVLREPETAVRLMALIELSPFSRAEFDLSYQRVDDVVEQARRTLVRSWMSFGRRGTSGQHRDGFRYGKTRDTGYKLKQWAHLPEMLRRTLERMRGVLIENLPAAELLAKLDGPRTLFYLDPPYPQADRKESRFVYRHEMTEAEHRALAEQVRGLQGMVLVSGYEGLYSELYAGWPAVQTRNHNASKFARDNSRARNEILWLSPNCTGQLFDALMMEPSNATI